MSGHDFEFDFAGTGSVDMSDRTTNIDKAAIEQLTALAERYPQKRSALMPMLHYVQSVDGRVSPRGIEVCAEILGITPAQVSGVATFYTMYKRRPAGKHHIGVCTTALCAVMGGDALLAQVERKLGIKEEETTADGLFSLERVECNAACDFAPVMMVNWEFMDNMTPDKADQLLDDLAAGREVQSTRGPVLTSWADSERVLAGIDDGQADAGPSAGGPSLAGVKVAEERGWRGTPDKSLPVPQTAETPVVKMGQEEPSPVSLGQEEPSPVSQTAAAAPKSVATAGGVPAHSDGQAAKSGTGQDQTGKAGGAQTAPATPAPAKAAPTSATTGETTDYGEGSYRGSTPPAGFDIKGNENSMLYHHTTSPWYDDTTPDVWFSSADVAQAAGFSDAMAYGDGSYQGGKPPAGYDIKGNADSMLFHTPDSPWYGRTIAEIWFNSADAAKAAGFTDVMEGKK